MNKFYILLLSIILAPIIGHAQQNFKPGYIVNLKGDTLKGQVDYREWNNNPSDIRFKASAGTIAETFSVDNACAFAVTGFETYRAFTVPVSTHSISISSPPFEMDTVKHPQKVFLKLLVSGDKVNLYSYTDAVKSRYYYSETGSEPVELDYWVYSLNGVTFNRRYRNQLSYLAQKYQPKVARSASEAEYDELAITKIVQQMNSVVSVKAVSEGGKATDFYIGGGINYSTLKFDGKFPLVPVISSSATPMPYFTVGVNCYANPGTRKLYFAADFTLTALKQKTAGYIAALDYKQYTAVLSPQIGCNFYNTPALKVFGNIGLDVNYSAYKYTYATHPDVIVTATTPTTTYTNYPEFEHVWINAIFKAGITVKQRLSIYAAYDPLTTITKYAFFAAQVSGYQLGVNLMIGK